MKVPLAYKGECKKICPCSRSVQPVCGSDNKTYLNECMLECQGVRFKDYGPCPKRCNCSFVNDPVCGKDGKTYFNMCKLECDSAEFDYKGPCKEVIKCDCP